MDGHDADDTKQSTADMTAFGRAYDTRCEDELKNQIMKKLVQNLLQQMQSRFQAMSDSIITKIDEMGNRIDELEQSINDLKLEIGVDSSPSPSVPPKSKVEPKSADDSGQD